MSKSGQEDGFHGTLFPVFVTADASLDQINQLIRRSDEFILEAHMSETTDLYLIASESDAHSAKRQEWPLPASFESSFVGKKVSDLAPIFKSQVSRRNDAQPDDDRFSDFTFGIIDEQSLEDGTILCISILEGAEKPEQLRADVEIAAMIMMGPEVSGNQLTEGLKPDPVSGVFYERLDDEKRKHYLEGSDDEEDEDEEEDEEED